MKAGIKYSGVQHELYLTDMVPLACPVDIRFLGNMVFGWAQLPVVFFVDEMVVTR